MVFSVDHRFGKLDVFLAIPAEGFFLGKKSEGFVNLWTDFGTLGSDFTLEEAIFSRGSETLLSKGSSAGTADVFLRKLFAFFE